MSWYVFSLPPLGTQLTPSASLRSALAKLAELQWLSIPVQITSAGAANNTVSAIELSIVLDIRWDEKIHGTAETSLILVKDVHGESVLFSDTFILLQHCAEDQHNVTITVPMFEPVPQNHYVSDRWLHAETRLPISFKHLIFPKNPLKTTPLLDLQPLRLSALHDKDFEAVYANSMRPKFYMRTFSLVHWENHVQSSLC